MHAGDIGAVGERDLIGFKFAVKVLQFLFIGMPQWWVGGEERAQIGNRGKWAQGAEQGDAPVNARVPMAHDLCPNLR